MLIARTEPLVLPSVSRLEWREPSAAQDKDQFGNSNFVGFRFRAINPDGRIAWQGCTRSREDADAFLFALVEGTLDLQPGLWDLPYPAWHPGIAPFTGYEFSTVSVKVSPLDTLTDISKPSDWNDAVNLIAAIAGGASGGVARGLGTDRASGGGAGALAYVANQAWPGVQASFFVGSGGASRTQSTTGRAAGAAGGLSSFRDHTLGSKYAEAGATGAGQVAASGGTCNGGTAGAVVTGSGNAGGRGGNSTANADCSGGGGAAGDTGVGNQGVDPAGAGSSAGGNGGTVSAGTPGSGTAGVTVGGAATSSNGGTGSGLYNDGVTSVGPGGGSGGSRSVGGASVDGTSGSGGAYGAASGGGMRTQATGSAISGAGGQGFVAFVWTPVVGGGPLIDGGQLTRGILIRGGRLVSAPAGATP